MFTDQLIKEFFSQAIVLLSNIYWSINKIFLFHKKS